MLGGYIRGGRCMASTVLYLETPRILLEVLITFHISDEIKVLLRLLAEAYV